VSPVAPLTTGSDPLTRVGAVTILTPSAGFLIPAAPAALCDRWPRTIPPRLHRLANERRLLDALSAEDARAIERLLTAWLGTFEVD
jgi:hypothetical protein